MALTPTILLFSNGGEPQALAEEFAPSASTPERPGTAKRSDQVCLYVAIYGASADAVEIVVEGSPDGDTWYRELDADGAARVYPLPGTSGGTWFLPVFTGAAAFLRVLLRRDGGDETTSAIVRATFWRVS